MSMKDIFCQDRAVTALERAVATGHVAGSYIFAGPEGVGKFTTAREWARVLLCEQNTRNSKFEIRNLKEAEGWPQSCGKCESCRAFAAGEHPDFHHIYKELVQFTREGKDKKTPTALPIDVVREFLIEKVAATPRVSSRKVFVISEAEKMLLPAQNALLKVLEEPPADSHIILLCTRLDKLLPTTLSRCQVVKFGPISEERIVEKLGERGIDKTQARYWARFTDGSLGRSIWWSALQIGEQNCYSIKRQLISRVANLSLPDCVELAAWIGEAGKAMLDAWEDETEADINRSDVGRSIVRGLIYMVATVFSDAMKMSSVQGAADSGQGREEGKIINLDQKDEIARVAGRTDSERCAEIVADAYKAMNWIEANVNEKLVLEDLLLSIGGCGTIG
jgi:DNA polymerase III subunit delta'